MKRKVEDDCIVRVFYSDRPEHSELMTREQMRAWNFYTTEAGWRESFTRFTEQCK